MEVNSKHEYYLEESKRQFENTILADARMDAERKLQQVASEL